MLPRKAQNNIRCHSVANAYLVSLKSKLNISLTEFGKIRVSAGIYLFKVNNRNTRIMFEICSKLTIKILERLRRSGVFIVNLEQISHIILFFLLLTLNK